MKSKWIELETPISKENIDALKSGDTVLLSGVIYTARDKAHQRLCDMFLKGEKLPVDLNGEIVYYVGPTPKPDGKAIGSAGPTTSYRMDPFTETMLDIGIKGMIGKGKRGKETRQLLTRYKAVYFSSYGGAGAYLSKRITSCQPVAFDDLGPEAIYKIVVDKFPLVVINDTYGNDLYESAIAKTTVPGMTINSDNHTKDANKK